MKDYTQIAEKSDREWTPMHPNSEEVDHGSHGFIEEAK
jgi:hypothetical protein